jgi:DNA-binding Lrp family transcriptional regulator
VNALDERVVRATQAGLPLVAEPYRKISEDLGIAEQELLSRLRAMLADGRIRRIGAVPNHYALGYTANAMSVWDVDDAAVARLGREVGALEFVSHCYRRPRRPPEWPYNLFAMVHGRSREETARKVEAIRARLGAALRAHDVLYSTRILKKTGLRL